MQRDERASAKRRNREEPVPPKRRSREEPASPKRRSREEPASPKRRSREEPASPKRRSREGGRTATFLLLPEQMGAKASIMSELPTTTRRPVRVPLAPLDGGSAPRVLIADLNPASRAAREQQLRALGCRVSVAHTGFEAIVKASCQIPDLILLDASLEQGEIETAEVSRLLTTCPVTSHIPIVRLGRRNRMPPQVLTNLRRRVAV